MADSYPSKETAYGRLMDFENVMCRRRGRSRMERYRFAAAYFSGENLPPDNVEQPLAINYARMLCEKATHFLFGQWERTILGFRVIPLDASDGAKATAKAIEDWIYQLCRQNNANEIFWEAGLNASIYGDAILRATWDNLEQHVRWESILPEYAHFRWKINNLNEILELVIAYPIPRSEAMAEYGTAGNVPKYVDANDPMLANAMYWEYWTPWLKQAWIDDTLVDNAPNPYVTHDGLGNLLPGLISYVQLPNLRAGGEFYGYNDTDGILNLQDELNRKMADAGDIINNFAHPITIVNKFYGENEELPVGPDQVWNLGREGEAKYLTWSGPPPGVDDYVDRIMQMLMDTSSMSMVAFGRHQGTQQSGIAMAIELLPVTDRARWKRMHWETALRKLIMMSAFVTQRSGQPLPVDYATIAAHEIEVLWAPVLPRDRLALVNENVTLVVNHLRSLYRGLQDLQEKEPDEELKRIMDDLDKFAALGMKLPGFAGGQGSSSLPDGASDKDNGPQPAGGS